MNKEFSLQLVIGGVGGQGVLFVTRLLAEAAMEKGMPVFTSETHGMAQRGGTVISHLKVGNFVSPLIRPGQADGLIALKAESLNQHSGFLKPGGWAVVNGCKSETAGIRLFLDADRLARETGAPRSANLFLLGYALACFPPGSEKPGMFHCDTKNIAAVLTRRLKDKPEMLETSLKAMEIGAQMAMST